MKIVITVRTVTHGTEQVRAYAEAEGIEVQKTGRLDMEYWVASTAVEELLFRLRRKNNHTEETR